MTDARARDQRERIPAMRYAKNPRHDFVNWAMWMSATCNFAADLPGRAASSNVRLVDHFVGAFFLA
jgi:hypothetical protein